MWIIKLILGACVLLYILYKYGTRKHTHWSKRGIKQMNPFPFLGDNMAAVFRKVDGLEGVTRFYNYFKGERFGGIYVFQVPFLVVRDPELLKQIMVKDAEYFINRHDWSESSDPLMSRNLVTLKDDKWRNLRTVMTTVFTSSKMKDMFKFMNQCAENGANYLRTAIEEKGVPNFSGQNVLELDIKDYFSRYGTDVIASTAFGLEVDSFKNPKNEFFAAGDNVKKLFSGANSLKFMLMIAFPGLAKKLNVSFFGTELNNFFTSIVSETIRDREENNRIRKDVIHVLMEARKGKGVNENNELIKAKLQDFTDLDIAAQAILFFFGGFESIASALAFTAYELAINPDVQKTLQDEIDDVIMKENGVTYDGVMHQMQYLNMVFNESLRKWPIAVMSDREVSKTYTIPKTDTSPEVVLERGEKILITIAGLHYDPEYFPNPEKFDPERFRDEKNTIKPFTYLPFGAGLRHCIGMRYALMEAKTVIVHMLRHYDIVPVEKTQIPLKLIKNGAFMLYPEKGFHLGLKRRNKSDC